MALTDGKTSVDTGTRVAREPWLESVYGPNPNPDLYYTVPEAPSGGSQGGCWLDVTSPDGNVASGPCGADGDRGDGGTGRTGSTGGTQASFGAVDDEVETDADVEVHFSVLANDVLPPAGASVASIAFGQGAHGTVEASTAINWGGLSYRPEPGFSGEDSFTYTITDSTGRRDTATVHVTVEPRSCPEIDWLERLAEVARGLDAELVSINGQIDFAENFIARFDPGYWTTQRYAVAAWYESLVDTSTRLAGHVAPAWIGILFDLNKAFRDGARAYREYGIEEGAGAAALSAMLSGLELAGQKSTAYLTQSKKAEAAVKIFAEGVRLSDALISDDYDKALAGLAELEADTKAMKRELQELRSEQHDLVQALTALKVEVDRLDCGDLDQWVLKEELAAAGAMASLDEAIAALPSAASKSGPVWNGGAAAYAAAAEGGTFMGGNGADLALGAEGRDVLKGRGGHDVLDGAEGNDRLVGNKGHDDLNGGSGRDTLLGGGGHDHLDGGDGQDILKGNGGDDELAGGRGRDILKGQRGSDELTGGGGRDKLIGGGGNDELAGSRGPDVLRGGSGADMLSGGAGNDRLIGGAGADMFVFKAGRGRDVVADFDVDEDSLLVAAGRMLPDTGDIVQRGGNLHVDLAGMTVVLAGVEADEFNLGMIEVL